MIKIKQHASSKMKLMDIIIVNNKLNKYLQIYPVMKSENNEIYIQLLETSHGNYKERVAKKIPIQIKMISDKGNDIVQNQYGLVYMRKYIGRLIIKEDKFIVNGNKYYYAGNILEQNDLNTEKITVYNLYRSDFKEIINNAVIYKGTVEFDDLGEE